MMRPALLVVGCLVVFGGFLLVLYGWSDGDDSSVAAPTASPAPEPTWTGVSRRLGAINRDRLAVCVDVVGEGDYLRFIATEQVRDALDTVSEGGPYWFSEPQPVVDAGCPDVPDLESEHRLGQYAESPSYYALWVFVISRDRLEQSGRTSGFSTEEVFGEGDVFGEVTAGLYLMPQEICDRELVAGALAYHLRLTADYPELGPTPYFDAPPTFGVTPSPAPTPCY